MIEDEDDGPWPYFDAIARYRTEHPEPASPRNNDLWVSATLDGTRKIEMTSTVTIEARCDANTKEVRVSVSGENANETFTLQDGEKDSRVVYDDLEISVKEVLKEGL